MKERLEDICNLYIDIFENKQGLTFVRWADDVVCGLCEFNDGFMFNFYEIVLDIELNAPKGVILYWHSLITEHEHTAQHNYKIFLTEFCN
jgi:hypothetical protein